MWGEPGARDARRLYVRHFNSLAPCGANQSAYAKSEHRPVFQLTRPVWGEPRAYRSISSVIIISTHSPRVGRTAQNIITIPNLFYFNSLAPCGANPPSGTRLDSPSNFNSLAPCGANRFFALAVSARPSFQLTRPVWGEPDVHALERLAGFHFNSLAPCGANHTSFGVCPVFRLFQLTRPVWGEPAIKYRIIGNSAISTHSPRVGRTTRAEPGGISRQDFNSLAPCGANRGNIGRSSFSTAFQLTRPVWGEPLCGTA